MAHDEPGSPEASVESLPGVGRVTAARLQDRGICTAADLLFLLPRLYHDERVRTPLGQLTAGNRQVTTGIVSAARSTGPPRRRRVEVSLEPPPEEKGGRHGLLRLVWFRAPPRFAERFERGARLRVAGTVDTYRGVLQMAHPEVTEIGRDGGAAGGIEPHYPEVAGVPPRILVGAIRASIDRHLPALMDPVPEALCLELGLPGIREALRNLHRPAPNLSAPDLAALLAHRSPAHARLAFTELFLLELARAEQRTGEGDRAEPFPSLGPAVARGVRSLPFEPTEAQRRALAEIVGDLGRPEPMRRLLQGDVGSGKTAVAMVAACGVVAAGAQVAFMAPTEVLAEQHHRALAGLAGALGLRLALLTGSLGAEDRRRTLERLLAGEVDLVVGTHALLGEEVRFRRLRLVVVDEQHRFGVAQRLALAQKTEPDPGGEGRLCPHLLVMTATPIPRSLALVLYGDLSVSVLRELPPGRIPPVTRAYPEERREEALRQLERALAAGGQAFVICPAVEEGEDSDLRAATATFAELSRRLGEDRVGLMHGRLSAAERRAVMDRFSTGEVVVLVSTTVVEVGVDVPGANLVLVEHAERFGLAQLHQLRGRVGRRGQRSACLLVHRAATEEAKARIRVLCESCDGFRIAEEDLALRGPGELFGQRQSGFAALRFGNLLSDLPLLERARDAAHRLLAADPELTEPAHLPTRRALNRLAREREAVVREEAG